MNWYVLFVLTGKEYKVEQFLNKWLDSNAFSPFVPLYERIFKISGTIKKDIIPLFPGYVFIESGVPTIEFIKNIRTLICDSNDIVRILKYADNDFAMRESEKHMLLSLCNEDYCIESSSGIIEGDRILITDGPLKGCESIVRKVDRHKKLAWIELEFMGDKRLVNVTLQITRKSG